MSAVFLVVALSTSACRLRKAGADGLSLSGIVETDTGSPKSGAIIRIDYPDTGIDAVAISDEHGRFRIPQARQGKYEITIEAQGYRRLHVQGPSDGTAFKIAALSSVPLLQLTSADIIRFLPDSPDKMTMVHSCVACHSLGRVFQQGRTRNEWIEVLKRMQNIPGGYLRIDDSNRDPILNYLSTYLGPDSGLPQDLGDEVKRHPDKKAPLGHDLIYTEYSIPTPTAEPHTAVPDHNGNVWFTEFGGGKVGRLEIKTGMITEYTPKIPDLHPHGITVGPDGTIWYTVFPYGIGRIDPKSGQMDEIRVPEPQRGKIAGAHSIIVDNRGKVWFTEILGGAIGSYDPATHEFRSFLIEEGSLPYGIVEHGDGIFWFALLRAGKIGYLDSSTGGVKTFATPTTGSEPQRLRFDGKGQLWFGEYEAGKIGNFDPATQRFQEYELPFRGTPYSVHIDKKGYVWVACFERDSLIRFNPETKQMQEYPLPGVGVIVRDIWPDEQGRMWFVQWGRDKVTSAEVIQ